MAVDYRVGSPPEIERLPAESSRWYARLVAYCLAGPDRTLIGVYRAEREKARKSPKKPPTVRWVPAAWKDVFKRFEWAQRAKVYDAAIARRDQREHAEEQAQTRQNLHQIAQAALGVGVQGLTQIDTTRLKIGDSIDLLKFGSALELQLSEQLPAHLRHLMTMTTEDLAARYAYLTSAGAAPPTEEREQPAGRPAQIWPVKQPSDDEIMAAALARRGLPLRDNEVGSWDDPAYPLPTDE